MSDCVKDCFVELIQADWKKAEQFVCGVQVKTEYVVFDNIYVFRGPVLHRYMYIFIEAESLEVALEKYCSSFQFGYSRR